MGHLTLRVLGTPELRDGNRLLTFRSRKALALLIYLALEDRHASRDEIAVLLWPDIDPSRARALLRSTLNYVRQALRGKEGDTESSILITEGTLLGVDRTTLTLDVDQITHALAATQGSSADQHSTQREDSLQQLQHAVAVYRGEALAGFVIPDAPEFEAWVSVQREYWHRQCSLAFERLIQLYETGGELTAARDTAARWIVHDRLNEDAYRQLIRLSAAIGERTTALQTYATYTDLLATELHAAPAADLTVLIESLRTKPSGQPGPSSRGSGPEREHILVSPFVGRADEYTHLIQCYQSTVQGRAQMVIIDGKAGMGKTRLADQFLRWAQAQGADLLLGRAFDTGQLAYGPLIDAIRPRLERERALDDLLTDVWLSELSRLLPELRDRLPDLPPAMPDEPTARARLFESMARLGEALTMHAPVILFIDDAQWADTATRDMLHYATRQWATQDIAMLVLLTLRHEDMVTTPALAEWRMMLHQAIPVTTITLDMLSQDDVHHLVTRLGGTTEINGGHPAAEDPFATRIYTATGGYPLAITELLTVLRMQDLLQPPGRGDNGWSLTEQAAQVSMHDLHPLMLERMREEVQQRYKRFAPATRDLVGAAAVLGNRMSFEVLVRVAGLTDGAGLVALEEALQQRVLVEQEDNLYHGPSYLFRHDNIRDIVYTLMGTARRRVIHRRALEVLRDTRTPAAALAQHARLAGDADAAFSYLVAAGDAALEVHAPHEALDYYEAAHQMLADAPATHAPDNALLERLYRNSGRAYEATGQPDTAQASYAALQRLRQG